MSLEDYIELRVKYSPREHNCHHLDLSRQIEKHDYKLASKISQPMSLEALKVVTSREEVKYIDLEKLNPIHQAQRGAKNQKKT